MPFQHIHAFEPVQQNYSRLTDHVRINDLSDSIVCHNIGAGDTSGEFPCKFMGPSTFVITDNQEDMRALYDLAGYKKSSPPEEIRADSEAAQIRLAPLDTLLDYRDRPLAIKLDVEGQELPALRGMKNLLANNAVLMQVEIHAHQEDKLLRYLTGEGFEVINQIGVDFFLQRSSQNGAKKNACSRASSS